jgi:Family of unknown function (DUF6152)
MQVLKRMLTYSGIAFLSLSATAVYGHHSYTKFDMNKTVTLEGTVKEFQWTNPHVWIQLLVKDPATGKEVEWSIESDSPNMLKRRGWTRKSLQSGDKAVALVHPQKLGDNVTSGALEKLTVNGKPVGAAAAPRPAEEARQ